MSGSKHAAEPSAKCQSSQPIGTTSGGPLSNRGEYKPGDIVNGHVLGSDNQWYPLVPGAAAAAGQSTQETQPAASPPTDTSGSAGAAGATGTPVEAKSGWSGLSGGRKAAVIGGGILGLFIVGGALGSGGGDDSNQPQATTPTRAVSSPTPTPLASKTPTETPDPDVATFWATLSPEAQQMRCASYRDAALSASAVGALSGTTSSATAEIQAHLEQACPPPPPKNYASLDERTWQLIAKDPDAYQGQTFLVFGQVTQFDSATGQDTFRADVAHANTCSYGFFDGDNTLLSAAPGVSLSNVVNDDVFAAQVTVVGSMTYDTAIGGSATVPVVQVDSIEVQPERCDF